MRLVWLFILFCLDINLNLKVLYGQPLFLAAFFSLLLVVFFQKIFFKKLPIRLNEI
jgi:hypothetical protein